MVVLPAALTRVIAPFDLLSVTPVVLLVPCVTVPPDPVPYPSPPDPVTTTFPLESMRRRSVLLVIIWRLLALTVPI